MRLNRDEWTIGIIILLLVGIFQFLLIMKFHGLFIAYSDTNWNVFMRNFHMSGFDPYIYKVVTDYEPVYDIFRHPLLHLLLFPLYLSNQLLWMLTGTDCAQFVVGTLMSVCAFLSSVFLYRILHEQIGVDRWLSVLLVLFFFGFAYVLLATFLPDHFGLSLCCLLLVLSRAGEKQRNGSTFSLEEALLLIILTAGITLTNGIIVLMAVYMTNGRRFLNFKNVLLTGVLPLVLLLVVAATTGYALSSGVTLTGNTMNHQLESTEVGASRGDIIIENFFGESLQMHRKHVLGDVLVKRPVVVRYSWRAQYVVETVIAAMFLIGIWCGRRSRLMWLCVACFVFTVLLHLVVAFGINEVYIMTAHWAYVIPIAIAFLLVRENRIVKWITVFLLAVVTIYLWTYHGVLLYNYLTWPLKM